MLTYALLLSYAINPRDLEGQRGPEYNECYKEGKYDQKPPKILHLKAAEKEVSNVTTV